MGIESEIFTIDEVARLLHLHRMTVYRFAKQGKLPGFKVGGRWRFRYKDLENWMADRAQIARLEGQSQSLKRRTIHE